MGKRNYLRWGFLLVVKAKISFGKHRIHRIFYKIQNESSTLFGLKIQTEIS